MEKLNQLLRIYQNNINTITRTIKKLQLDEEEIVKNASKVKEELEIELNLTKANDLNRLALDHYVKNVYKRLSDYKQQILNLNQQIEKQQELLALEFIEHRKLKVLSDKYQKQMLYNQKKLEEKLSDENNIIRFYRKNL